MPRSSAAQTLPARPRLRVIEGGRGRPELVTVRHTDHVAPALELIAVAQEQKAAGERMSALAVALLDHPSGPVRIEAQRMLHEAGRMVLRADEAISEGRRLAGDRDGGAA